MAHLAFQQRRLSRKLAALAAESEWLEPDERARAA
jgi:hypothetical protein